MENDIVINNQTIEQFKKIAQQRTWMDVRLETDFETIIDDFAGGNVDDAYEGGYRDGQINTYRQILEQLGVEYTKEK